MNSQRLAGRWGMAMNLCLVLLLAASARAWGHPAPGEAFHSHDMTSLPVTHSVPSAVAAVSGQGDLKFRVFADSSLLPEQARAVLKSAHGGFAVDRRPGKGETYFSLPKAGIVRIGADLKSATLLDTAPEARDVNLHNTTLWHTEDGSSFLVFPANDAGKVLTTTLEGRLLSSLDTPAAGQDLGAAAANDYFAKGGKFVPTDVAHLGGLYYVTTGYSPLDFVLTARVADRDPLEASWNNLAFGGKGGGPGQFGTGHGITVVPGGDGLVVADRPNSEIDRFSPAGEYRDTLSLPKGSFPCDVDYEAGYAIVGCLHGPDHSKGAPIYILKEGAIVSTILPKEELGLAQFQHVHNAVARQIDGRLYVIAQAWNPGDFAIFEQVKE
jgi:hypothetical protein